MSRQPRTPLFSDGALSDYLDARGKGMQERVARIPEDQLLNTPVEDLVASLCDEFSCEPLVLKPEGTRVSGHETKIPLREVQRDPYFRAPDDSQYVSGHCYNFHVPFDGDLRLWKLQGSILFSILPYADVEPNELVFSYAVPQFESPDGVKQRFNQDLQRTAELVKNSTMLTNNYNSKLPDQARAAIERRRADLLKARKTVASFGFPLRTRDGASTQPVPLMRKRLVVARPSPGATASFGPEHEIDSAQYEEILRIISNMSLVFERSPSTFKSLDEEAIRTHFLVHLNGQFEGAASGETFNAEGKTDILIRVEGKNVFIAECKFWKGPKGFTDAIDQLLSYTSWRDTKTALLVFNRDTQTSTIVNQVPALLEKHPRFKRNVPQQGEGRFRAIFAQPNDANRELWLTVLVFDVPG